jgi:hypothetical protein
MTQVHEDILISRIVGGDATADEWNRLTELAAHEPVLWQQLGETLRDHASFARALNASVAAADDVELPASPVGVLPAAAQRHAPFAHVGRWSGWAVAAVVAVAWITWIFNAARLTQGPGPATNTPGVQQSNLGSSLLDAASAPDLLKAYLDRGKRDNFVIDEVPDRILIDTRPSAAGEGYEVYYLRQILERAIVPELYEYSGRDEMGRPTLVRFEGHDAGPGM